jgi:hypothetical protein
MCHMPVHHKQSESKRCMGQLYQMQCMDKILCVLPVVYIIQLHVMMKTIHSCCTSIVGDMEMVHLCHDYS